MTADSWLGFVDDQGKFSLDDRRGFQTWIKQFAGKEVLVTVAEKRSRRTLDQLDYWWAVPVKLLADELGYTPNQMHYALLGEWGGYRTGPTGQPVPNVPSSGELNAKQMAELIDWVLTFAPAELGIVIPPPDPTKKRRWRKDTAA